MDISNIFKIGYYVSRHYDVKYENIWIIDTAIFLKSVSGADTECKLKIWFF